MQPEVLAAIIGGEAAVIAAVVSGVFTVKASRRGKAADAKSDDPLSSGDPLSYETPHSAAPLDSRKSARGPSLPVTDVMIPEADIIAFDVPEGTDVKDVTIADPQARMREVDPPSYRLPIRDASRAVRYVVHYSTLCAFADKRGVKSEENDAPRLGDLLADPEFRRLIEAIAFVRQTAEVSDARLVMASVDKCNDLFVTRTGRRDERAIGWLTNTLPAVVN